MLFIDTHTHLYLDQFDADRHNTVRWSIDSGVGIMLLPNIDHTSWKPMLDLCEQFPSNCYAMAGLHPTSVLPESVENELAEVKHQLETGNYIAVGEIGIDLYWDKTHQSLQEETFRYQLQLAKKHKLPVAIHVRKSFEEVWHILKTETGPDMKGVFHCFPGDEAQARRVIDAGFLLGIGGVVTFKNSGLQKVVAAVGPQNIVLETDAPFLAPAPYRGKRNEPSYIPLIAEKVAELCGMSVEEVAEITTRNAVSLFNLKTFKPSPSLH
ncbi:MAG: TatD family hydrolase [Lentimicrobiaceae bacterium]|jgi:TatD DNase family protein